jgi:peptide/nickel transport system substrate-binding protein
MIARSLGRWSVGWALVLTLGCGKGPSKCDECGTAVVAATGDPATLVPPLVVESVERDISDQVFERLAVLAPGASPIDARAYRPGLADKWDRVDSLTWRFHLRPNARWHDGKPVTASDVAFSFDVFTDSIFDAGARPYLAGVRVTPEDSSTVRIAFRQPSPEQLYDATYHVRILPQHVWDTIPRQRWAEDTTLAHLVGSGPYHLQDWQRGRSLSLVADSSWAAARPSPPIRRVVWRFAPDPDAGLNLILSHEADLMETVGAADRVQRVAADTSFRTVTYPAAVYGFLAFRVADAAGRPHPSLGDRDLRRALTQAVDRPSAARALFGEGTKVPPGPMSQLLWIWDDNTPVLGFDSTGAREAIARIKAKHPVRPIDILVPATSSTRRKLALVIQEAWRKAGVNATVTTVEFPVFQERLANGKFDCYIGAYLDEPTPRGLRDQWTRAGWGALNYGHYGDPVFDSLLAAASREPDVGKAKGRWREAMDTINADAPAIFLYALANTAAVQRRLEGVKIDPYSWLSGLSEWKIDPKRALARDSVR